MVSGNNDAFDGGRAGGLPDTVLELFPDGDQASGAGPAPSPPDACASCGDGTAIQWLKMVTDWEDIVSRHHGVAAPEGVCLIPLCNRCRAWAEIIEIAEMAVPHLPESEQGRILQERDRFLESLDVELIRGMRVSEELSTFSE